ncbi:peptide/nickel transport system substrate-binding protein [Caldanaerobius fijiensis DSM 17918]|uniref:Peptide/nickel transport system substrate-binding protein n=1 Tax=Caldanaerobius fijiensis DSM 17918 TaxID=1121256 RepID=A0A1M4XW44_9THEO|nr:ABC transporter substrate-binding protein [Caldanaerobius fijiensis]SHE97645.1 peptide/nickel transport system substrate-binding protein [Caldanaerobius fijiensis DSM 17918]
MSSIMKRLSLILAVVFLLSIFLVGCKKSSTEQTSGTAKVNTTQENTSGGSLVNKDKRLVIDGGIWDAPPVYHGNPFAAGGIGPVGGVVFEPLFQWVSVTGEYYPRLGESMEDKGTETIVHLRKGVVWQDGKPFTSKDVLNNYYLGFLSGWMIWTYLDSIEAPDDYTVVFKWKQPTIMNKFLVSQDGEVAPYHIYGKWGDQVKPYISKRDAKGQLDEESNKALSKIRTDLQAFKPQLPLGTGPFKVKTVTASDIICEKFNQYWGAKNVHFNQVRYVKVPTNEVAWSLLRSGQLDYAGRVGPKNVMDEILQKNSYIKMYPETDLTTFSLIFNMEKAPFNDLNFRKAIVYAINRDTVREVSLYYSSSVNDVATYGILPSIKDRWLTPDFQEKLTKFTYDPSKAESILKEAGYSKGSDNIWRDKSGKAMKYEISVPGGWSDWVLAAENMATQLTQFGIPTKVRTIDNAQYWDMLNKGNYDMAIEFGVGAWGFASHPFTTFNRIYNGLARELGLINRNDPNAKMTKKFKGPNGEDVDVIESIKQLAVTLDEQAQKEIINKLVFVTNENVIFMDFLEKKQPVWINTKYVEGWPDKDDPLIYYAGWQMIVNGQLKPR